MFICFNLALGVLNFYNGLHEDNTGSPLIPYKMNEQVDSRLIRTDTGATINASDPNDFNSSIQDVIGFDPMVDQQGSFFDLYAFYSFVVKGARILIQMIVMPFFGVPQLLADFGFPAYIYIPVAVMGLLVIVMGLIEFLSNRSGVFS